jgi:hypothetical protein
MLTGTIKMVCVIGGEYNQTGCTSLYMMMIDNTK